MNTHSQGPWRIWRERIPYRTIIMLVEDKEGGQSIGEMYDEERAQLAAAAPELLEAAKALLAEYDQCAEDKVYRDLVRAVAKAEGK